MATAPSVCRPPGVDHLLERFYPIRADGQRFRDGTSPFYAWLHASLDEGSRVLNVGAGPTPPEPGRRLRGSVGQLIGVDVDPAVLTNTDLDEAHVIDGVHLPYEDNWFDAVYSDWTMEHVEHPKPLLREIHRVLRPGGSYWLRTTNLYHYVTVISKLTPHWFHTWTLGRLGVKRIDRDPWPTFYRCNTPDRIRTLVGKSGFSTCEIRMVESHPTYLSFSRVAFLLGVAYERVVNASSLLSRFRLIVLAKATKGCFGEDI